MKKALAKIMSTVVAAGLTIGAARTAVVVPEVSTQSTTPAVERAAVEETELVLPVENSIAEKNEVEKVEEVEVLGANREVERPMPTPKAPEAPKAPTPTKATETILSETTDATDATGSTEITEVAEAALATPNTMSVEPAKAEVISTEPVTDISEPPLPPFTGEPPLEESIGEPPGPLDEHGNLIDKDTGEILIPAEELGTTVPDIGEPPLLEEKILVEMHMYPSSPGPWGRDDYESFPEDQEFIAVPPNSDDDIELKYPRFLTPEEFEAEFGRPADEAPEDYFERRDWLYGPRGMVSPDGPAIYEPEEPTAPEEPVEPPIEQEEQIEEQIEEEIISEEPCYEPGEQIEQIEQSNE